MEKLNLAQQQHTFTNQKKCTITQVNTNKSSAVAEMGDRLATIDIRRKAGVLCPILGREELGPHRTQCRLGRGLPPYDMAP